jgi:hypothetical protein
MAVLVSPGSKTLSRYAPLLHIIARNGDLARFSSKIIAHDAVVPARLCAYLQ